MRLDALNERLGVKSPAEIFKKCPRCKREDLFEFEGEVFCNRCPWDSVLLNAEVLAAAQLRFGQSRGTVSAGAKLPVTGISQPYLHLFFPAESPNRVSKSASGSRPEIALSGEKERSR